MTDGELWQLILSGLVAFFVALGHMLEAIPWRWVFLFLGINSILSYLRSINKTLEALHRIAREYREFRD